jgi:hypothetical protein
MVDLTLAEGEVAIAVQTRKEGDSELEGCTMALFLDALTCFIDPAYGAKECGE